VPTEKLSFDSFSFYSFE